ncbi:adhesion G-protein coupled receptor D1-like [Amphiura filiformis]|uniref:adhesion G-protein coupled receptor D1-like n=1 Tax=Amphiura filiformis TaxID=82378 RepID=UPI003B21AF9B
MFMTFRDWSSERYLIHINFTLAQLSSQILFLIGEHQVRNQTTCKVFAICTHLTFLSAFFWVLVEALDLHFKMVLKFDRNRSKLPFFMFLGWGAPAAVVIICAGNNSDQYGSENSCWVEDGNNLIWAFIGPSVAVVLLNTVLVIITFRAYLRHTPDAKSETEEDIQIRENDWITLRGIIGSTSILAMTWLYGFLLVGSPSSAMFQYAFVLSNGAQGVIFFILFCFLNTEVRQSWKPPPEPKQKPMPKVTPAPVVEPKKPSEPKKDEEPKPADPPKHTRRRKQRSRLLCGKLLTI